jgi:hypothetical protein
MFQAHQAGRADGDLVLVNTPADSDAAMVVAHFPLEMVDAWGEGTEPPVADDQGSHETAPGRS